MKLSLKDISKIKSKKDLNKYDLDKPIFLENYLFHYLILFDNLKALKLMKFPVYKTDVNNYNGFHLAAYNEFYDILEYFIGQKCLCCSTLMCRNNWGPQKNLKNILQEILKTFNTKQRVIEYLHVKKIKDKYLIDDIPIFDFI